MDAAKKPLSLDELNPWARWGINLSYREGRPALTDAVLWTLELNHPEAVERDGDRIFLFLDRTWRVVPRADRAWMTLEPAPFHERKKPARPS
jgi:hypothetical protein